MSTEFEQAARLSGDNPQMRFWQSERIEDGLLVLCEIVARNPNWRELALRLSEFMLPENRQMLLARIRNLKIGAR